MPIIVVPGTSHGPALEPRHICDLRGELEEVRGAHLVRTALKPGDKGAVSDILMDPATAAAVVGAVRIFSLWLKRDRRRTLTLTRIVDGQQSETIEVSGRAISLEVIEEAVSRLAQIDMDNSE